MEGALKPSGVTHGRMNPHLDCGSPREINKWKFHASVNRTRSQSSLEEVSCFLELSTVAKFQLLATQRGVAS
jgi:hypothetical protein